MGKINSQHYYNISSIEMCFSMVVRRKYTTVYILRVNAYDADDDAFAK